MIKNKLERFGLNANALKIVAVIAMIIDHIVFWWIPSYSTSYLILRGVGRIVAPIMCYFIAEGYFYTSNKMKYLGRIFLFAIISHFPYVIYFDMDLWSGTGVIWTLFLGLLSLMILKSDKVLFLEKIILIIICLFLARNADWNYVGVLWILGFGFFRDRFLLQILSFIMIGTLFYLLPAYLQGEPLISFRLGIFLAIPFLAVYDGTRGKKSNIIKWGFYIIYPLHLIILNIFRNFI